MSAEFSTRSLQLAIYLHAARALPYLRTEASSTAGKVNFVFRDDAARGQQFELDYNRGAAVVARDLFAAQTFLRREMSAALENSRIGESSDAACPQSRR